MVRVLLVCPERLGHGYPAGVGIRFLEFARALRASGHSLTILSPDGGEVSGCRSGQASEERISALSATHDIAIVQGHIANDFFAHAKSIPTVVDLYDPFPIENLHYSTNRNDEIFMHDHSTIVGSLESGDFFLCASEAQRMFYLGMLYSARRIDPAEFGHDPSLRSLLAIAPFGVAPPRIPPPKRLEEPALLFGGIYDWYDPITAIDAMRLVRNQIPGATLTFNVHPNPDVTPQSRAAEAREYVEKNRLSDLVRFEPWVAYEQRAAFYDRFTASLLTFSPSLETDLAMRTRIFDYLWGGLPVVTTSAQGTDEILRRFGAGIIAGSTEPRTIADAVITLHRDRTQYEVSVGGALRFAHDNQWVTTLQPLLEFCRHPRISPKFPPKHAPVERRSRASILHRLKKRIGSL